MSVVDKVLKTYGFVWKTNPYRIEDSRSHKVIFAGSYLDLRENTLRTKRQALDKALSCRFK